MYKSLIVASMLFVATTVHASEPKNWCEELMIHASRVIDTQETKGKIDIPGAIPSEDTRAYKKLISRTRRLMKKYPELTKETLLNIVKSDCADVYNPSRNGKL